MSDTWGRGGVALNHSCFSKYDAHLKFVRALVITRHLVMALKASAVDS